MPKPKKKPTYVSFDDAFKSKIHLDDDRPEVLLIGPHCEVWLDRSIKETWAHIHWGHEGDTSGLSFQAYAKGRSPQEALNRLKRKVPKDFLASAFRSKVRV